MPPEIEPEIPQTPKHGDPAPGQEDDLGYDGGPDEGGVTPPAASTQTQQAQSQQPASSQVPVTQQPQMQQAPIIVNGRQFRDAAELAAYTSLVEQNVLQKPTAQNQKILIDGKPLEDVMFNDPERYHEWSIEQAKASVRAENQKVNAERENTQRFWDDFYKQNPDLRDQEWVVKAKFTESFPEISKLSVSEAMSKLANDSRGVVDTIKQKAGVRTKELPNGGATTLGTSGAAVPRGTQPPAPQVSFIDQVRAARKNRAK